MSEYHTTSGENPVKKLHDFEACRDLGPTISYLQFYEIKKDELFAVATLKANM
jgi:hypothetical protein